MGRRLFALLGNVGFLGSRPADQDTADDRGMSLKQ
jgi:hypothetical protein